MCFYPWQWYYNKTQHKNAHITKITHHAQTKHSTQAPQTLNDTLHAMNTTNRKVKGRLWFMKRDSVGFSTDITRSTNE
jgi:uncharacterized Fe-S center protein